MISSTIDEDDDEDNLTNTDIPCPKVSTNILENVIKYCTHYKNVEAMNEITTPFSNRETLKEIVRQDWYVKFVSEEDMEREMLFDLVAAANYMNIQPLLDLSLLAIGVRIKGKSVDEMRSIFNISHPPQQTVNDASG